MFDIISFLSTKEATGKTETVESSITLDDIHANKSSTS